jgi:hypothetical protein
MHLMRARQASAGPPEAEDPGGPPGRGDAAGIGHLAARFDIERRAAERHVALFAFGQLGSRLTLGIPQRHDRHALNAGGRVTLEGVGGRFLSKCRLHRKLFVLFAAAEYAAGARFVPLRFHRGVVGGAIHLHAVSRRGVFDEVVRDAERVIQAERRLAAQDLGFRAENFVQLGLETRQALGQDGLEPVFFSEDGLLDHLAIPSQLRVSIAHFAAEHAHQRVQKRLLEPEVLPVPHGPPHDLSQDVAPPFVGRDNAVGDEKGRRSHVIRHDPHRDICRLHRAAVDVAGPPANFGQQRHEQIGVVIRILPLHDRRDALEAHAGVD